MMGFTVEHNIPIPNRRNKYPWNKMGIWDSFFVPGKTIKDLRACASAYTRRHPAVRFAFRRVDGVYGGVRVWRIPCDKEASE